MLSQFTPAVLGNRQLVIRPEYVSSNLGKDKRFLSAPQLYDQLCGHTPTTSATTKRPWREADHCRPSSDKVKNAWSHTSTLLMRFYVTMRRKSFTAEIKYLSIHR